MSDATGFVVGLIALASTGITKKFLSDQPVKTTGWEILTEPTTVNGRPPTSEAGVRPQCAVGEKAKFNTQTDEWQCVPSGWD